MLVLVLATLAALAPFAIDTYLPAFHVMAAEFGTDGVAIQQSLTFYLLPYAIMTLCHGAISDAIGRIKTIKWGLGIFVVASVGCAFAPNVQTLWLFRALQGVSGGAGNTVARAMVRDLFSGPQAQRVMATVQLLFGIAPAVAPILGGLLLGIHWQAIFVFLALYAAIALGAAVRYLPETMTPDKRVPLSFAGIARSYGIMLQHRTFVVLITCLGLNFAAFFIYVLASPVFLVEHLHLSSQQFGFLFIPTVTGMMLGSWISRHSAGKLSPSRLLRWAFVWMVLVACSNVGIQYWAMHTMQSAWWLAILPIALFNIGMAAAMPVLSIAALDCFPAVRGAAASAQAFMQMLCSTLSSAVIVPLMWDSPLKLALTMLVMTLMSAVLLFFARRQPMPARMEIG
ncbi:MFS transporter, DHA1 family, bicyclomycin/chloramphenicol resistance protein [Methylophilus rhizosphaerae]|uniref:Bcr/CflA family efflux transporter n=1 Tax=Methylophilus rhizosphaerae TaxID=492660 RepID=A0A1G8Z2C1_9PROT|nr:MFS transporter, DHA1 family, bicyclomycin/chloramphenicol resistance protein [Methylophilus rhizosphaerae]